MNPVPPPSPPRYVSRGQRLKSRAELEKIRSIAAMKRAAKKYTKHMVSVPPSLASYADCGSSGAGSSRRRRAPSSTSSSSWDSQGSNYRDYMMPEHIESSEESDGDRICERDFVDNDENEARITARMKRCSELQRCREVNDEHRELDEALCLIERQKAEEAAVERLRRKQAAEEVIVVPSDDEDWRRHDVEIDAARAQ